MADDAIERLDTVNEILLDVASIIELSPTDRRLAENRYRKLKQYLERDTSALKPYLNDGDSVIYAQGSIATGTTIVSGTEDDRFDLDAIVELIVPADWSDKRALDVLYDSLDGFPGSVGIERCTRCVQIQFASMHMDVTILDRRDHIPILRAGEIFHSPDHNPAYRVPSNPWGFTDWYRSQLRLDQPQFIRMLKEHRDGAQVNRLHAMEDEQFLVQADAEQLDLPPVIPTHLDAQESVALKLLKRFLNLEYENVELKRPPSIYLTKRTGDYGYQPAGLSMQLYGLASSIAQDLRSHIKYGTRPEENNPSYPQDQINDRWPREGADGVADMECLAKALENLCSQLEIMASAPLDKIAKIVDELFGERVGKRQRVMLTDRYKRKKDDPSLIAQHGTGQISAPAIARSTERKREIPAHNFHPGILKVRR